MFPIIRYGADTEEAAETDKDSILKALKKNARRKSKLLKRKCEEVPEKKKKETKKAKQNGKIKGEKVEKRESDIPVAILSESRDHENNHDEDSVIKMDMEKPNMTEGDDGASDNVPEKYDPLELFKMGLKAPRQALSLELLKSRGEKLPEWLEHPFYVETDINNIGNFNITCFHEKIRPNLVKMGINRLFPVQTSLIPALFYGIECEYLNRPNDICVCSPTGSGKTLAFAIPVIQYLLEGRNLEGTCALVIVPTVELAKQVHGVFAELSQNTDIKCVLLGGTQAHNEINMLCKKSKFDFNIYPDVIVSTPGRLAHFLKKPDVFMLENLRFLVIDEADRILDLIKQSWLQKLKDRLPNWQQSNHLTLNELLKPKIVTQKLLFSATLNTDPERLKDLDLFRPRLFIAKTEVKSHLPVAVKKAKYSIPPTLTEYTVCCETSLKPLVVLSILINLGVKKALCFTGTAETARRLFLLLNEYAKKEILKTPCLEFSSLLNKKERKHNMSEFTTKSDCILICSDAVARGIDAVDIEVVILYDLPQFIEAYVHRAGRASRAGNKGSVYNLVTQADMVHYKILFRNARLRLPQDYQVDDELVSKLSKEYGNTLANVQSRLEQSKKSR